MTEKRETYDAGVLEAAQLRLAWHIVYDRLGRLDGGEFWARIQDFATFVYKDDLLIEALRTLGGGE